MRSVIAASIPASQPGPTAVQPFRGAAPRRGLPHELASGRVLRHPAPHHKRLAPRHQQADPPPLRVHPAPLLSHTAARPDRPAPRYQARPPSAASRRIQTQPIGPSTLRPGSLPSRPDPQRLPRSPNKADIARRATNESSPSVTKCQISGDRSGRPGTPNVTASRHHAGRISCRWLVQVAD
jgi:hypothetical protein